MQYRIVGTPFSAVICNLDSGETMITERGSMSWMTPNVKMETKGGGVGKMFGKLFSGEAMFQNHFTAEGGPAEIAFSTSFPGSVIALEITPDRPVIVQKAAFLAATEGVELSIHFNKKLKGGLFGGEGFIMQKISGNGIAFVEIDGHAEEYYLQAGQSLIVDTGNLAMMEASCTMDIKTVPGVKNMLFGGEGIFNTVVTGPGKILVQTMPVSNFAATLIPYLPTSNN